MMIMNDIDCGNDFVGNYLKGYQFTRVAPLHTEICKALRDTHFQYFLNERFTHGFSNTCLITYVINPPLDTKKQTLLAGKNSSHSFCTYLQCADLCNIVGEKSIINLCKNVLEQKFRIVLYFTYSFKWLVMYLP